MKKIALAVMATLALTACGTGGGMSTDFLEAKTVVLPDGRTVVCVVLDSSSYAGGLDCDWENAR